MTWHLRDRELEKKLIEIDCNFAEKLNALCDKLDSNNDFDLYNHIPCRISLDWDSKGIGEVFFTGRDVEHVSDYNPNDWNEESKVRPPKGIRMRVEGHDTSGNYFRTCAIFIEDYWYREDFGRVSGELCIGVERFRPWED